MDARDEMLARGYHGGGMDEGAHGGGAGHGVGKPGLEGELRRLARRRHREGGRCRRESEAEPTAPLAGAAWRKTSATSRGAEAFEARGDRPSAKAMSPMRVTMKALRAARPMLRGRAYQKPMRRIAAEADAFPAEVEEEQVVGEHQDEHGGDEEIHLGEEPAVAVVVAHEADGVEEDEEGDEGDDEDHDEGEGVEIEG